VGARSSSTFTGISRETHQLPDLELYMHRNWNHAGQVLPWFNSVGMIGAEALAQIPITEIDHAFDPFSAKVLGASFLVHCAEIL